MVGLAHWLNRSSWYLDHCGGARGSREQGHSGNLQKNQFLFGNRLPIYRTTCIINRYAIAIPSLAHNEVVPTWRGVARQSTADIFSSHIPAFQSKNVWPTPAPWGNLGGIHLLFFLMRYLPRLAEVKPLTLLLGGAMFGAQYGLLGPLEYLAYAPASQVCLAPAAVVYGDQFSRILTGMLRHTSDYHLFHAGPARTAWSVDGTTFGAKYGKMIFAVSILTQIAICISAIALTITRDDSWAVDCYIGLLLCCLRSSLSAGRSGSPFGMQMPSFVVSPL